MTKTDALLYAQDRIRVNSVHPGFIWTPLVEELARNSLEGLEAFRRKLDSRHPIGHVGEPDDVAYGIVYLASDEAKFVTGSELVIDGGYTAQNADACFEILGERRSSTVVPQPLYDPQNERLLS